jgi:hypothetical protein
MPLPWSVHRVLVSAAADADATTAVLSNHVAYLRLRAAYLRCAATCLLVSCAAIFALLSC